MHRAEIIQGVIDHIGAVTYLEIGIGDAGVFDTFQRVECTFKVGVDIDSKAPPLGPGDRFFPMSSRQFFDHAEEKFDVIFIDGDHSYEESWRDFVAALDHLNEHGVILLHDSYVTRERPGLGVFQTVDRIRRSEGLLMVTVPEDCGITVVQRYFATPSVILAPDEPLTWNEYIDYPPRYINLIQTKLLESMLWRQKGE
jgi:hypothetical protein